MRPDWPTDQNHGREYQPHFRGRNTEPIPLRLAPNYIKNVGNEADEEGGETCPSAGDVQIKNTLDRPHGAFRGSDKKCAVSRRADQKKYDQGGQELLLHAGHSSRRYSPKSHSSVKNTTSNATRKPMPFHSI